jgi:hypothetical protein
MKIHTHTHFSICYASKLALFQKQNITHYWEFMCNHLRLYITVLKHVC